MSGRLLSALVAVVLAAGPAAAQSSSSPTAAPSGSRPTISVPNTTFTLPNGLTVILHEDHSVPKVAVNVWYHVGSAQEKPGRTGFAHLFEHLMFEGSAHVREGEFDAMLESVGGSNNGSTTNDRTNYFETVPSNALDIALFLESDRMGYLLDVVTPDLVDSQRDVVKNERRQRYENTPYGMVSVRLSELLYPATHPYHWPVIGYMEDLTAATQEDVRDFFQRYYSPSNASLVVAGDIDVAEARKRVEYWFSDVKPGPRPEPLVVPTPQVTSVITETLTDRVQLPRLYLAWLTPALYAPGDAELDILSGILADGKNSRLYKRLVYDMQIAQDVSAVQYSARYGSMYVIDVTPRPSSDAPEVALARLKGIVDEELKRLASTPPSQREVDRVKNGLEASFFERMEVVSTKADYLNAYFTATGKADYFAEDLGRYQRVQPGDVSAIVRRWLPLDRRVELSVVPAPPASPTPSAAPTTK